MAVAIREEGAGGEEHMGTKTELSVRDKLIVPQSSWPWGKNEVTQPLMSTL